MLVVFENRSGRTPLILLRSGFRHCYIFASDEQGWQIIDPLCSLSQKLHLPVMEDTRLMAGLAAIGVSSLKVSENVELDYSDHKVPLTCVENIKQIIGIDRKFLLTPYQLFTFFIRS